MSPRNVRQPGSRLVLAVALDLILTTSRYQMGLTMTDQRKTSQVMTNYCERCTTATLDTRQGYVEAISFMPEEVSIEGCTTDSQFLHPD